MKKIWTILIPLLAVACTPNTDFVTASGVEVNRIVKGTGPGAVKDSIVVLALHIKTEGDSTLTETTSTRPMAVMFDPEMEAGDIQEVLTYLEEGDSVAFSTTASNLFEQTYRAPVPPSLTPETKLKINMKFIAQFDQNGYRNYMTELSKKQEEKDKLSLSEKLITDGETIDNFLAENKISATKTESGLRYVITQEGNGTTAEPGDEVVVHYDGKLMSGDRFDSSIERGTPFSFTIGRGQVIPGWDEGIALISEGGKGTLYIPSPLGYGSRGAGPKIKPFSILVFDVEVIEVKKAQ